MGPRGLVPALALPPPTDLTCRRCSPVWNLVRGQSRRTRRLLLRRLAVSLGVGSPPRPVALPRLMSPVCPQRRSPHPLSSVSRGQPQLPSTGHSSPLSSLSPDALWQVQPGEEGRKGGDGQEERENPSRAVTSGTGQVHGDLGRNSGGLGSHFQPLHVVSPW